MPSPFPGMDPYIESWIWGDFHFNLISTIRGQLNARLPKRYVANSERYVAREAVERHVRIVDSVERRIVTVIEVLSPGNKTAGASGQAYRLKREEYIGGGLNLVEIDLLRSGIRPPLGDPAPAVADYYVLVNRAADRPRLGIWPVAVRDPLPPIPVPLDEGVADAVLDLRACIDRVYDEGRYGEQLDYTAPPSPPLREPDAAWARELLAGRPNPI